MIEATGLTKRYDEKVAVDDLSFTIRPGIVTGFLGPNRSGKPTTLRMIPGLEAPTSGVATVNGRDCAQLEAPLHEVGALLEARAAHTSRSARNHLRAMAATTGISRGRVEEVIYLAAFADALSNIAAAETGPPDPPRTRLRHTQAEFPVRPNARHRYQNGRRVACLL
jgi:ABC-2 type transport system ATP-binding protein